MKNVLAILAICAVVLMASWAEAPAGESAAELSRRAQAYDLYTRAQMLMFNRQEDEALALLEEALQRDPNPELLLDTARAHSDLGHFDRALELAQWALKLEPGMADAWLLQAEIHLDRARTGGDIPSNVDAAITAYRQAVATSPDDAVATRSLADLYAQTGRLDDAAALLEAYGQKHPLTQPMGLLLARIYVKGDQAAKAEPILAGIVSASPTNLEAVDALAGLYESDNRVAEAIELYAPALEAGASSSGLFDRLGLLQLEAGHDQLAVDYLEKARAIDPGDTRRLLALAQAYEGLGSLDQAASICDLAVKSNPENLEVLFHRARLYRKAGDVGAARDGFQDVVRLAAGHEALTERETTIVTLSNAQIGLLAMGVRDYDTATLAFSRAVEMGQSDRPDLVFLLARAQLEHGDLDAADQTLAQGVARYPDALEMRVMRGEVLLERKDDVAARAYFRALLTTEGNSVEAYVGVGEALMRRKRFSDADTMLAEGLKRHKDDDRVLFSRGAALERMGRIGPAERALGRAVTVNPKNAMALNYLGYMLADNGVRLSEAASYVEQALKLDPENPAYLDSMGWALFKMQRFAPAEKNLRAALRYDGADPAIREHLGDLLVATGRTEEAVHEWETALACGHEEPDRVREKMAKAQERIKTGR